MAFRKSYALATAAVFAIEVVIALFLHDALIRPYVGDALAVILVYLGIRSVTRLRVLPAVLLAFFVATLIEFAQYFHLLDVMRLGHNRLARIVLGGVFDLHDFVAYAAGAACAVVIERLRKQDLV